MVLFGWFTVEEQTETSSITTEINEVIQDTLPIEEEVTIPSLIMICAGGGLLLGNKIASNLDDKDS